jgi:hypothetical protein
MRNRRSISNKTRTRCTRRHGGTPHKKIPHIEQHTPTPPRTPVQKRTPTPPNYGVETIKNMFSVLKGPPKPLSPTKDNVGTLEIQNRTIRERNHKKHDEAYKKAREYFGFKPKS